MRTTLCRFWLACFCVLGPVLTHPGAAQEVAAAEVSAGYQYLRDSGDFPSSYPLGWYVDAAYRPRRPVALVGQLGGGYDTRQSSFANEGVLFSSKAQVAMHHVMAGARLTDGPGTKDLWFVQAMAGAVRVSADGEGTASQAGRTLVGATFGDARVYPGVQFGGGVSLAISRRVGIRAGFDLLRVFHAGESERNLPFFTGGATNFYRLTAGIVLPFARRSSRPGA